MRPEDLAGRRVVLLGLGADVRAARPAIEAAGPSELAVVDQGGATPERGLRQLSLEEAAEWGEVFVRSPGFRRYQRPLLDALQRGARMTTPVDLWLGARPVGQRVVAVTGTKGKSTTSHLIRELAEEAGLRVGMAGNMGVPIFSGEWDSAAPVVVVEISSYQAADLHSAPDVAVLTALAEDHLDWHGDAATYHRDKLRVLCNDGGTARRVFVPAGDTRAVEATAELDATVVHPPASIGEAPRHRVQNAALAAAVVAELGGPTLSDEQIVAAAHRSLPGRLDRCDGPPGSDWIDDALGSNPTATSAGLAWAREQRRPTIWLVGGAGRGVSPQPLVEEVRRWDPELLGAIALPDDGEELARTCGVRALATATDLADAVALAAGLVEEGGLVLFSPAAPTPPAMGDWKARSDAFRTAVAALPAEPTTLR